MSAKTGAALRHPWSAPFLRWAGSKRKLVPELLRSSPNTFTRYLEPFAGSACLFFALRPACAVLGDINVDLLETYETLKCHPRLVARAALSIPVTERDYYLVRDRAVQNLNAIERAARFIFLNRYCFNGVYRTNRSGKFNVPFGIRTGKMPPESAFYRSAVALRDAALRVGDFDNCLTDVRTGDFVYLDPPYSDATRTRGEYGYESFSPIDLERLVKCLQRIEQVGATFLLSYAECSNVRELIPDRWFAKPVLVRRHVAGFSEDRKIVKEILVANYQAW